MGTASVVTQPTCAEPTATIVATPNTGYHFVQWSDSNTENPRHILVREDITLTAIFAADEVGVTEVEATGATITTEGNVITVQGATGQRSFLCSRFA